MNPISQTPKNAPDSIEQLHRSYIEHVHESLVEIVQLKNDVAKGSINQENLARLYGLVHNLGGSGTTFGFPAISRHGQALAGLLKPCTTASVDALTQMLDNAAMAEQLEAFEKACNQAMMSHTQLRKDSPLRDVHPESKKVCILSTAQHEAASLDKQLQHFGYQVFISQDMASFSEAVQEHKPHVLIVYSDLSAQAVEALKPVAARMKENKSAQLILVCPVDGFEVRLAAVRLGANGFFPMPVDVLQIIDKIEQLVEKFNALPAYHVVIVDDDEMLMKFYTLALEQVGIITTSVASPKEALEVIANQSVDLVLIDFLMPYCNGQELAAIIRQHEKYVSLPIIFMSARDDVESLLRDTGLGIDDFLVKPLTSEQLVSVVRSRAQRSAELQVLMARDSFTGLLNHGHFMDMLGMELVQAQRYQTQGAYVIIDIDHFKSINDTYGHLAGDHVIKGLARMLQQRLRRSDIIGRCGGEEFGIIMPDCDLQNATHIVESMRLQFADLAFRVDDKDIRVTFSAGLASLGLFKDVDTLIKSADAALYEAKRLGRNRLILV